MIYIDTHLYVVRTELRSGAIMQKITIRIFLTIAALAMVLGFQPRIVSAETNSCNAFADQFDYAPGHPGYAWNVGRLTERQIVNVYTTTVSADGTVIFGPEVTYIVPRMSPKTNWISAGTSTFGNKWYFGDVEGCGNENLFVDAVKYVRELGSARHSGIIRVVWDDGQYATITNDAWSILPEDATNWTDPSTYRQSLFVAACVMLPILMR